MTRLSENPINMTMVFKKIKRGRKKEERKFQIAERCNPVINYMLCSKIIGRKIMIYLDLVSLPMGRELRNSCSCSYSEKALDSAITTSVMNAYMV